jgi:Family of unknown function (DUF6941)
MGLEVLHMILCDRVETDPDNYHRCNVFGLITSIQSAAQFPVVHPQFVAFVVWTGGQGAGELMLRIIEDVSTKAIFRTRPRPIRFVGDPTAVGGFFYRIRNCRFPAAGLYWIKLQLDGLVIARQRLFVRHEESFP